MSSSSPLLRCVVIALIALIAGCTDPPVGESDDGPRRSAEQQAPNDETDEDDEEPEPEASGDDVLPPAARVAKTRLWQAMIHAADIDPRMVQGDVEGQTIVLRIPRDQQAAEAALRALAARHLDAEGHPWRVELGEPLNAQPAGEGLGEEAAGDPPAEERTRRTAPNPESLRQLLALTGEDAFERDPRLEYDRDEPAPAHIVRAATGDRPLTYRVRAGDSLSLIAQRTMGSGNHWQRIHELNRHIIGPDPARLVEGMELRIPQD